MYPLRILIMLFYPIGLSALFQKVLAPLSRSLSASRTTLHPNATGHAAPDSHLILQTRPPCLPAKVVSANEEIEGRRWSGGMASELPTLLPIAEARLLSIYLLSFFSFLFFFSIFQFLLSLSFPTVPTLTPLIYCQWHIAQKHSHAISHCTS